MSPAAADQLPGRLVATLCGAEVLGMLGFAAFPALVPTFIEAWSLTNTQAGTISGAYFGGYMVAVPVLVSLTDRVDARRIYLGSTLLAGLSLLGFAFLADGFWPAAIFQALTGVGLAGTYMPGLKLLSDRVGGPRQSRFIAFYTSSFSIGAGLSYFMAGEVAVLLGWRWAFGCAAAGALLAIALVLRGVPPAEDHHLSRPDTRLLDFRPVLRSRATMMFVIGYAAHVWELFALRSWLVAFLVFSQSLQPPGGGGLRATVIAAIVNLIGLPASFGGNELAMRFGRRRYIIVVMSLSALFAVIVGFSAGLPYWLLTVMCFVYAFTVMGDSASLTAGAVANAPEGYRGAAMAVHSTLGFGAGFAGAVAVGVVLDLTGGTSTLAWGLAFGAMGLGVAVGPICIALMGRRGEP